MTVALGVQQGAVYTILGPLGDRAVIGPSPADPDFVGYLTEPPSGLERAAVRASGDPVAEGDGRVQDPFFYDGLAFTLTGMLYPDAGASSVRANKLLAATDAMDAEAILSWPAETGVSVQVAFKQAQPTRITDRRPKKFLVAGESEDPVVYSVAETSTVILPDALVAGGFGFPMGFPLTFAPAVGGQAIIHNAGRSKTYPRLIITGPCSNPYVTNVATGQTLYFAYTLADGEFLLVDLNPTRRSIRLNDQANRYSALDSGRSSWWPLLKGDNVIRIGYTAYSAGAQVQVLHRDAWG